MKIKTFEQLFENVPSGVPLEEWYDKNAARPEDIVGLKVYDKRTETEGVIVDHPDLSWPPMAGMVWVGATKDDDFGNTHDIEDLVVIEDVEESALNESNLESLKLILKELKDATDEELNKIVDIIKPRITWGTIYDMAGVVGIQDKISK